MSEKLGKISLIRFKYNFWICAFRSLNYTANQIARNHRFWKYIDELKKWVAHASFFIFWEKWHVHCVNLRKCRWTLLKIPPHIMRPYRCCKMRKKHQRTGFAMFIEIVKWTYGAILRPTKNWATSWSVACQGSPRARTTTAESTSDSFQLKALALLLQTFIQNFTYLQRRLSLQKMQFAKKRSEKRCV